MLLRNAALRLLPVVLLALAACSESTTKTETSATTKATPDTGAPAQTPPTAPPAPADTAGAPAARPAVTAAPTDTAYVQDAATYLAGLPVRANSELAALAQGPAYQAFAKDQDKSWAKYTSTHTSRMTRWATHALDSVQRRSPTIFYPFSGPDFLNVATLFPTSQTYVMVGLEPVGSVPARASLENPKLYPAIKASLWSVLNFSFFRTNDMAIDLKSVELDGAVPLIMLFAARTGHQVLAVRPVQLTAAGQLTSGAADTTRASGRPNIPGAEIQVRSASGQAQTIYYFSADISDAKLTPHPALLTYARTLGPLTTYVKSATYLMHKAYFSKIRNLVLARSNYLLQDDSGIAMKYFPASVWQFTYYGTYRRPINLFAKHYQPALTAAYTDSLRRPSPLPFGTGYNWRQTDSNLLLAQRRTPVSN
ncbi:hypothetical protein [Hymenobacter nivis]|uniref:Uncharacterized protein n=1 Tax=Hymenobacter nivis TaxID=1850093 RepID=A0A2Z3GUE6_9BACT|nr:hypothetical protein [Hymenobacter nivis]AWM34625.1 hypothetical protein DDQ68_18680 [Hymenobacter nivis]